MRMEAMNHMCRSSLQTYLLIDCLAYIYIHQYIHTYIHTYLLIKWVVYVYTCTYTHIHAYISPNESPCLQAHYWMRNIDISASGHLLGSHHAVSAVSKTCMCWSAHALMCICLLFGHAASAMGILFFVCISASCTLLKLFEVLQGSVFLEILSFIHAYTAHVCCILPVYTHLHAYITITPRKSRPWNQEVPELWELCAYIRPG